MPPFTTLTAGAATGQDIVAHLRALAKSHSLPELREWISPQDRAQTLSTLCHVLDHIDPSTSQGPRLNGSLAENPSLKAGLDVRWNVARFANFCFFVTDKSDRPVITRRLAQDEAGTVLQSLITGLEIVLGDETRSDVPHVFYRGDDDLILFGCAGSSQLWVGEENRPPLGGISVTAEEGHRMLNCLKGFQSQTTLAPSQYIAEGTSDETVRRRWQERLDTLGQDTKDTLLALLSAALSVYRTALQIP